MATASSVIGSLQVNIVAVTDKFAKGLRQAHKLAGGFIEDVKASLVGALAALPFAEALKHFVETGEELHHLSIATGISIDELTFLKYAAEQSGAGLETLTKAARNLQTLGIDPARFEEIAKTIASIKDPTMRAQSAMYYFGKRGALALLPMVNNLTALKKRFEQLGGGLSEKMVEDADAMGKSWGNLKFALAAIGYQIADVLAPYVTELSNDIADNGKAIRDWVKDNKKLIIALSATAFVVAILTPVLFILKTAFTSVTWAIRACTLAMSFFGAHPIIANLIAIGLAAAFIGQKFTAATYAVGALVLGIGVLNKNAQMIAAGGVILGAAYLGKKLGEAPAPGTNSDTGEVAKNTGETSDKMDALILLLKQMNPNAQPAQPAVAPVVVAPAGVR